jgi:hypothetical protein
VAVTNKAIMGYASGESFRNKISPQYMSYNCVQSQFTQKRYLLVIQIRIRINEWKKQYCKLPIGTRDVCMVLLIEVLIAHNLGKNQTRSYYNDNGIDVITRERQKSPVKLLQDAFKRQPTPFVHATDEINSDAAPSRGKLLREYTAFSHNAACTVFFTTHQT